MERRSWFRVAAGLKHFEHAIRDQKTAHNIAGGGDNRDGTEHRGQRSLVFSRQQDCANHGNGIESVCQGHQRRVQKRRYAADYLETDKARQHEYVKAGNQIRLHRTLVSFCSPTIGGSEKNSRTRALTTSPPNVTRVLWMISSSRLSWSFPSLTMYARNAVIFFAYIWLAWWGTAVAR